MPRNLHGVYAEYEKPNGVRERRCYFDVWRKSDGVTVSAVTIFPHLCGTCVGGNHTHVEVYDERQPLFVIREGISFSEEVERRIDELLTTKLAVDAITETIKNELDRFL